MTPEQLRMARAADNKTLRELGEILEVSAVAINRYEHGEEGRLGRLTLERATEYFRRQRIYFGPKHGVCIGEDVFSTERWYAGALFQLLKESGVIPSSTELLAAGKRADTSNEKVSGLPHTTGD